MAMSINTNVQSLNAQRNLATSQSSLSTTMPVSYTHLTLPTKRIV